MALYLPIVKNITITKLIDLFLNKVVCYFRTPSVSDLVNRDISTAKGSRKPIRLDCL